MKRTGRIGFGAVTIFLIFVTAFCCTGTVLSATDFNKKEPESCYRAKEKQLVCEARAFLNAEGFANSGIMLTHTTETDGSRVYTMTVHHAEIAKMSGEERQKLLVKLEGIAFDSPDCVFLHKFLLDE